MAEQKKAEEEIKTYKMIEGDYSVQIRVLEANDLIPTISGFAGIGFLSSKGSACNAFVEISVLGQTKRTKVVKNQLSPIFNQIVSFKLNDMKKAQLQNATLLIAAYDRKSAILGNKIIGSYELDLSSVYFSLHHELYRTYLALSDPTDEREGTMGYILCNITVLGPNDEPFVHDVSTEKKADATKGATLMPKKINQWPHSIRINLLKGEHMVPLDMTTAEIDAYVVVKYGGNKIRSKTVTSRNPEWYQQLNLACMLPNQSKYVDISVYDHDLLGDDDLVGTFQIPFKDIPEIESTPKWANLYGAPLQGESKKADMMNLFGTQMGSHYRGRISYTICRFDQRDAKTNKEDLKFHFPENPMPVSEQKSYVLRVDLLEGHAFPTRKQSIIQVKIGPYLLVSKPAIDVDGTLIFNENLPDKKVLFPKNVDEIPDVIIYMADDNIEDRRHSFIRVKAKDILDRDIQAKVFKLTEDRSLDLISDDEFPGFLYANVQLMSKMPGQRKIYQPNLLPKVEYELRVYLYLGRNLPPADATGTSDPLVKIRCAGQMVQSKVCTQTLNPGWYETLKMNVKLLPLEGDTIVPAGMFVMVFDEDLDENNKAKYDLIGRVWITLQPQPLKFQSEQEIVDMYYHKPKWYNIIYDATNQVQGQILLAYSIIPKEKAFLIPDENIYPNCIKQELSLFCIGLRNIEEIVGSVTPTNVAVSFDISGDAYDPIYTDYKKVKARGVNINRLIPLTVDVPKNQNFCPVIDCYVWNQNLPDEPKLLGVQTMDLAKILTEYYRTIRLKPGEVLQNDEQNESDQEEEELMKTLDDKKKQASMAQIKEANINEEEESFNLDKLDLNIPQELPFKKRVVEEYEYDHVIKEQDEEMQRYKEEEEELIQQSKIGDSNVQDLLNLQEEAPIYKPTTFGGGFQGGQASQIIDSDHSQIIIEQFPREENIPQEQNPIKVTKPMDINQEEEGQIGIVQQLEPQIERHSDQQFQVHPTPIQLIVFTESQAAISPNQPSLSIQPQQNNRQNSQPNNLIRQDLSDEQRPESIPPKQSLSIKQQSISKQQESKKQLDQSQKESQSQFRKQSIQQYQQELYEQQEQKQVIISQLQSKLPQQSQSRRESQQKIDQQINQSKQSQQKQQSRKQSQDQLDKQESPQFQNIENELQQPEKKDSKSQYSQKQSQSQQLLRRDSQISQLFQQQRKDSQQQSVLQNREQPPSIPISPIQKGNPSNGSQQQLDDYNLNNDDSENVPSEPKSRIVTEYKMGRVVLPTPIQGTQRSIRKLSQVDQQVVFGTEQHINHQIDISKKQSSIIELKAAEISLKEQIQQLPQAIKTIQVPTDLSFSKASKVSSKALSINSGPKDNMDAVKKPKIKQRRNQKNSRKAKLFGFSALLPKKKKTIDIETYEDYDSEQGEDLDVTPAWLKGRKFLPDDLEDKMKTSKKFLKYTIMSGQSRGKDTQFLSEKSDPQRVCDFKCIFLETKQGQDIQKKKEMYVKMMRPKQFVCRLYLLQGIDIQSGSEEPPDLFIKIRTAAAEYELKKGSLRQGTNSPQFYFPFELPMEVPGSAIIEVEIWSQLQMSDEFIGKTLIDLEDRYFSVMWHKYTLKPIENRNIKDEFGSSVGRLQMWIDLVERQLAKANPMIKITPPPRYPFELRTIIYETRNCVFKDELEKCNDLYCKAGIANQELQETDTHWRCRAKGSFNWRIKNKVNYPPLPDEFGTNRFKIQLWDKDIVGSDELIGETSYDLNTHKMIEKAVKRLQPVQITQRIREKGGIITDKFWIDVYHPDAVDEEGQKISQGQVLVSFELMPLTEAEKKPNGYGRDPPNIFPPLAEPTGRLSFDITNPLGFIKDIMGPDLYNKICKFFLMAALMTVGVTVGWIFLGPLIANVIVK